MSLKPEPSRNWGRVFRIFRIVFMEKDRENKMDRKIKNDDVG